jgi:hypothetical protein
MAEVGSFPGGKRLGRFEQQVVLEDVEGGPVRDLRFLFAP